MTKMTKALMLFLAFAGLGLAGCANSCSTPACAKPKPACNTPACAPRPKPACRANNCDKGPACDNTCLRSR